MPTFTVKTAEKKNEYADKYGPKVAYTLSIAEVDDLVELSQKPETAPPSEGQEIDGDLIEGQYGKKLKKTYTPGSSNGGGGRTEDPKKSAEIRRMACQRAAIELLTAEVHAGLTFTNQKASDLLKPRVDWLEADVIAAGEKA